MKINFDISCGNIKSTYTAKIDNHIIEIELWNIGKNDFVKVWYSYNNNLNCIPLYLNFENKTYYGANLTNRQWNLIIKKVKQALKFHNYCNNIK